MTRDEAKSVVMFISGSYPNFKPLSLTETVDAWAAVFSEFDVEQVKMLVRSYIMSDTKGFPPTVSDIIQIYHMTAKPQQLNESEAWSLVRKAIGRGGHYALEDFAKFPPVVQKAVGTPHQLEVWGLDEHFNESVVSSEFIRCYRAEVAKAEQIDKMPTDIRRRIEAVNEGHGLEVKPYVAIEEKETHDGIPMPEGCKQRLEEALREDL